MLVLYSPFRTTGVRRARSFAFLEDRLSVRHRRVSPTDHPRGALTRSAQGDIRSRLVRLIPSAPANTPLGAVRTLLSHRLPANVSEREAREEWRDIIEGHSPLWSGIPNDRKETIRGPCSPLRDVYVQANGKLVGCCT